MCTILYMAYFSLASCAILAIFFNNILFVIKKVIYESLPFLQVREPETVAGHMFRMGVMGLLYSHKNKDTIRFIVLHLFSSLYTQKVPLLMFCEPFSL